MVQFGMICIKMENKIEKITSGGAVLLAILAIVMSNGLIGQEDIYACIDNELAMKCDSLSGVNAEGIQTRCYYEDEIENRTRYKNCKTGWLPYTPEKKVVEADLNFTKLDHIYLLCEKDNKLVSMCQVVDQNESVYKISVGGIN